MVERSATFEGAGSCGVEALYLEDLVDVQGFGDVRVINRLE
jgi:hypothetical protein